MFRDAKVLLNDGTTFGKRKEGFMRFNLRLPGQLSWKEVKADQGSGRQAVTQRQVSV